MSVLERLKKEKIIAIVRGLAPEYLLRLALALEEGGIRMMEVTYDQRCPESWPETARAVEAVEKELGGRLLLGAGTVINAEQVRLTSNAGGHYLVTPVVQPEIIRMGKELGLGVFPGALTPTEILTAWQCGADAVKVFPASSLGPGYIRSVRAPLSHIPLIAVGGINESNAAEYLKAGCIGLGIGGSLVNRDWIRSGQWDRITRLAETYRKSVDEP